MSTAFSLSEEELDDHRHVIAVTGEVDLFTAPQLKSALHGAIAAGKRGVVVDLSETSFIDSTALGVLIGALRRLREGDGLLVLVNGNESISRTLEITGLDRIFAIVDTREEAIAALEAPSAA
jgi:anti-sigma B factor antagonist